MEDLKRGQFLLREFYLRRVRRILPELLLVMLVSLPFSWAWMMPGDLVLFSKSLLAVLTFVSNFFSGKRQGISLPRPIYNRCCIAGALRSRSSSTSFSPF